MADEQHSISVTFKAGEGYAAPMVTVRGDSAEEVNYNLGQIIEQDVLDAVVEVAGVLVAKYGLTPVEKKPTAKPATDGQLKYLNDLRSERGLDPVTSISAEEASSEIERLKSEPKAKGAPSGGGYGRGGGFKGKGGGFKGKGSGGGARAASPKQLELIEKLANEKEGVDLTDYDEDEIKGSAAKASELIDYLIALPDKKSGKAWG